MLRICRLVSGMRIFFVKVFSSCMLVEVIWSCESSERIILKYFCMRGEFSCFMFFCMEGVRNFFRFRSEFFINLFLLRFYDVY